MLANTILAMCRCQGTAYANVHSTTAILSTGLRGLQFWCANPQFVAFIPADLGELPSVDLRIEGDATPDAWRAALRSGTAPGATESTWGWPDQYPIWDHPNWIFMQDPSAVFGMFRRVSCGRAGRAVLAGRAVRVKVGSVGHVSYQPCPQCSGCITCHG